MAVTRTVVIRILGKDQLSGILNPIGGRFSTLGRTIGRNLSLGLGVATVALGALGVAAVKTATSYEDAFTGVLKTTKGLADEFGNLNAEGLALRQQFKDLAETRPVSFEDISLIGELGGQLGIAKDSLADFTGVVSDLGATTNLTFEDAAVNVARFTNVMGTAPENLRRVGDVIVDLGNNFATTEEELLNFARRMAGAGAVAGLTESEVLAIGTAFSSVGVESELGGTAVQKVLLKMVSAANSFGKGTIDNTRQIEKLNGKLIKANADLVKFESVTGESGQSMLDLRDSFGEGSDAAEAFGRTLGDTNRRKLFQAADSVQKLKDQIALLRDEQGKPSDPKILTTFAEVSGRTVEQFIQDFESKPGEVFKDFIVGLGEQGKKGEDALRNLELGDQRLIRSFLSLGAASDQMVNALDLANNQWEEGGALAQEANLRYGTLKSQFAILKNAVKNLADSLALGLVPGLKNAIAGMVPFIRLAGPILENIFTGSVPSLNRMIDVMRDMGFSQDQIVSVLSFARVARNLAKDIGERLVSGWKAAVGIGRHFFSTIRNLFNIFKDLSKVFGARGGISGVMGALGFSPEVQGLINNIIDDLVGGFQAVARIVKGDVGPGLSFITDSIFPAINKGIGFINDNWELFRNIVLGIGAAFAGAAIVGWFVTIGKYVAAISFGITYLGAAIGILFTAWTQNWGGIRDAVTGAWDKVSPIFDALVSWLETDLPDAFSADSIPNALKALFGSEKFAELVSIVKTEVPVLFGDLINTIAGFFTEKASIVHDAILKLFGVDTFSELISTVQTELPNTLNSLITTITDFFAEQKPIVQKAIADLWAFAMGDTVALEAPSLADNMMLPDAGIGIEAVAPSMGTESLLKSLFGVESFGELFGEILVAIPEQLQGIVDAIKIFVTEQVPVIQETLQSWAEAFLPWVSDAASALGGALIGISAAIWAWAASEETMSSLVDVGIGIGNAIVTGIKNLFSNVEEIAPALGLLALGLLTAVATIGLTLLEVGALIAIGIIEAIVGAIQEEATGEKFNKTGADIINGIKTGLENNVEAAKQIGPNLVAWIKEGWDNSIDTIKEIGTSLIDGIVAGFMETNIAKIGTLALTVIDEVKRLLGISSPSTVFFDIGKDVVQGFIDGLLSNLGGVKSAIGQVFGSLFGGGEEGESGGGIGSLIGGLFGGGGEEGGGGLFGADMLTGFLELLTVTIPEALNAFQELFSLVFQTLTELLNTVLPGWAELFSTTFMTIQTTLSDFWELLLEAWAFNLESLTTTWGESLDAILEKLTIISPIIIQLGSDTATGIFNAFNDVDWVGLGESIGKGIEDGLRSKKNAIVDLAEEIARAALRAAKAALGVSSPSKEFFKVGASMMEGLEQGVRQTQGSVLGTVQSVTSNLIGSPVAGLTSGEYVFTDSGQGFSSGDGGGLNIGTLVLNGVNDPQGMFDEIERIARNKGLQFQVVR